MKRIAELQDAFMELANAYVLRRSERDKHQRNITTCGICWGLKELCYCRATQDIPYAKIMAINEYNWPRKDQEGGQVRSFFCLFMANLPPKDFKKLWDHLPYKELP